MSTLKTNRLETVSGAFGIDVIDLGSKRGSLTWEVVTGNKSAEVMHGYLVKASSVLTIKLPSPSSIKIGNRIIVKDVDKVADKFNITIARNGNTIDGASTDIVVSIPGDSIEFVYSGSNNWAIVQWLYSYAIYA